MPSSPPLTARGRWLLVSGKVSAVLERRTLSCLACSVITVRVAKDQGVVESSLENSDPMGDLALNLPAALNLVEPLDRQTLGERAYAKLADLLISGRLAPGEKLSLRAAADVLGVSIIPVREAVSRLIADKALAATPNPPLPCPPLSPPHFPHL